MTLPKDFDPQFATDQLIQGCETMKHLLLGLLDSSGRVADEVHAIRKLGKSLRGGFSVFRLEKSAGLEIQAIGRLLSGPRDAVSRFSTWNKLGWDADPKVAAAISGLLKQNTRSAARRPPPETITWCVERVDTALEELKALPAEDRHKRIGKGLKKLERAASERCAMLDHRNEEDFHEARKALKAWLGAVGFLPEGMIPLDPVVHELAEFLGDENDLATLSLWLKRHGFTPRFTPDLWKNLKRTRRKLQRKLIHDAKKMHSGSKR